jgi:hypothetical protein
VKVIWDHPRSEHLTAGGSRHTFGGAKFAAGADMTEADWQVSCARVACLRIAPSLLWDYLRVLLLE